MDYSYITLDRQGHALTCKLDNWPAQTFTPRMMAEMHHLLGEIEQDRDLRVLVVTGVNDVFIRWFDLTEMLAISEKRGAAAAAAMPTEPSRAEELLAIIGQLPAVASPIHTLAMRIQKLPIVTIAAINGHVGGGGCEFSLAFDFRIMKDESGATFSLPQSSFGLVPGGGGAWHCIRLLGRAKALDVLLHGEFMPPAKALELGLISRLFPAATYDAELRGFVENMAARAPLALRGVKALINYGTDRGELDFFAKETEELGKVISSRDVQHALGMWIANPDVDAYRPQFEGR